MTETPIVLLVKEIEAITGQKINNWEELREVIKDYHIHDRISVRWLINHPLQCSEWFRLRKLVSKANKQLELVSYATKDFQKPVNPTTSVSARTTISQTDTMNRYYGDICRNIDSAFILCGIEQEDGLCLGKIKDCPFRHELFGKRMCRLSALMALVEKR